MNSTDSFSLKRCFTIRFIVFIGCIDPGKNNQVVCGQSTRVTSICQSNDLYGLVRVEAHLLFPSHLLASLPPWSSFQTTPRLLAPEVVTRWEGRYLVACLSCNISIHRTEPVCCSTRAGGVWQPVLFSEYNHAVLLCD